MQEFEEKIGEKLLLEPEIWNNPYFKTNHRTVGPNPVHSQKLIKIQVSIR
mgnify:CR=1 FL=1